MDSNLLLIAAAVVIALCFLVIFGLRRRLLAAKANLVTAETRALALSAIRSDEMRDAMLASVKEVSYLADQISATMAITRETQEIEDAKALLVIRETNNALAAAKAKADEIKERLARAV